MIARKRRIALYSPGMVGLGHVRRNLLIAQALVSGRLQTAVLLLAEAREASAFAMPPGVDCFTLPALRKDADGRCRSRYLDLPLQEVVSVRSEAIRAVLEAFEPDALIVDHLPRGALGELEESLVALRGWGRTRCVLGLRDVLDDPATVEREWREWANLEAIRDYYDAIWVYGDRVVYDPVREYQFPGDVAQRVRFTGYLDHRARLRYAELNGADPIPALGLPHGRLVVCLLGGGQDGGPLAEAFVRAALPPDTYGVVLTGPFMPPDVRRRVYELAAGRTRLRVLEFLSEPALLLRRADRVVAMGGYNTIWEMLSFEKPALVVPRMARRREQWIRAERLRALGAVDVLRPQDATPQALAEWIARESPPGPAIRDRVDFRGLARLPELLEEVLAGPSEAVGTPPFGVPCPA